MPNAPERLTGLLLVAALAGCSDQPRRGNEAADANTAIIGNSAVAPAEIEALPADESSATPSNELVNGDDAPDVNAVEETNAN